jgi:carboxylesterase type B
VVRTTAGLVRGVTATDYRFFAGIPYAAPPVGPLRWQPPAPVQPWSGLRDATRPGARCIQDIAGDMDRNHATGEDCLTLNVWTPPSSKDAKPVLVWIHGGGFVNGSGEVYDARRLASRGDIVVVTLNYRLGALGFLAHPALGPAGQVGNYGLADQQAALRWVRDNIANFGGDPGKVTVAGESAGGMSVCDHLVAPGSAGLFRAQRSVPGAGHTGASGEGQPELCGRCGLWRSGDHGAMPAKSAGRQAAEGAVLLPIRQGPSADGADQRDRRTARRPDQRVCQRPRRPGAGADRDQSR